MKSWLLIIVAALGLGPALQGAILNSAGSVTATNLQVADQYGVSRAASQSWVEANGGEPDFTIIVWPDMQNSSELYPYVSTNQSHWILTNNHENLKAVVVLGDLVNHAATAAEWLAASNAIQPVLNAGIPTLVAVGNHDINAYRDFGSFQTTFPITNWSSRPSYIGTGTLNCPENMALVFTNAAHRYVLLSGEWGAPSAVWGWLAQTIVSNATSDVLFVTHAMLTHNGSIADRYADYSPARTDLYGAGYTAPESLWRDLLATNKNVTMTFGGHFLTGFRARRTELNRYARPVHHEFANYQAAGETGRLVIYTWRPRLNRIDVRTYGAYDRLWLTTSDAQYSVPITGGAGGGVETFGPLASIDPGTGHHPYVELRQRLADGTVTNSWFIVSDPIDAGGNLQFYTGTNPVPSSNTLAATITRTGVINTITNLPIQYPNMAFRFNGSRLGTNWIDGAGVFGQGTNVATNSLAGIDYTMPELAYGAFRNDGVLMSNAMISFRDVPRMINPTNFTVSLWRKSAVIGANVNKVGFLAKRSTGVRDWFLGTRVSGEQITWAVWTNTGLTDLVQCVTSQNVNDGEWHFLVGTWDDGNSKLWIDGVVVATNVHTTPCIGWLGQTNLPLTLGGDWNVAEPPRCDTATYSDVEILNYSVSASWVLSRYSGGPRPYVGAAQSKSVFKVATGDAPTSRAALDIGTNNTVQIAALSGFTNAGPGVTANYVFSSANDLSDPTGTNNLTGFTNVSFVRISGSAYATNNGIKRVLSGDAGGLLFADNQTFVAEDCVTCTLESIYGIVLKTPFYDDAGSWAVGSNTVVRRNKSVIEDPLVTNQMRFAVAGQGAQSNQVSAIYEGEYGPGFRWQLGGTNFIMYEELIDVPNRFAVKGEVDAALLEATNFTLGAFAANSNLTLAAFQSATNFTLAHSNFPVSLHGTMIVTNVQTNYGGIVLGDWIITTNGATNLQVRSISTGHTNLDLSTNGNVVIGNNLGIGTTSPTYKLDVTGTASAVPALRLTGLDVNAGIRLDSASANANSRNWFLGGNSLSYGYFQIKTSDALGGDPVSAGTARMTIDNLGNVGIGTTAPGSTLQIGALIGSSPNQVPMTGYSLGVAHGNMRISSIETVANNNNYSLLNLVYSAPGAYQGGSLNIDFQGIDRGNGGTDKGIWAQITGGRKDGVIDAGSGFLAFKTADALALTATERMRIDNLGNVGIGTTWPGQKLDVVGQGRFTYTGNAFNLVTGTTNGQVFQSWYNSDGTTRYGYFGYPSVGNIDLYVANERAAGDIILSTAGNVGIDTNNPQSKLHVGNGGNLSVDGTITVGNKVSIGTVSNTIAVLHVQDNGANKYLAEFKHPSGTYMTIATNGNVTAYGAFFGTAFQANNSGWRSTMYGVTFYGSVSIGTNAHLRVDSTVGQTGPALSIRTTNAFSGNTDGFKIGPQADTTIQPMIGINTNSFQVLSTNGIPVFGVNTNGNVFVSPMTVYPSNTTSTTPALELGSFATWNSNGLALWASWNTNGTVQSKQLAP